MPGTSKKTKVIAIRATPLALACVEAVAAQLSCTNSEAQRRMLRAGAVELLGAREFTRIKNSLPPDAAGGPTGLGGQTEPGEQTNGK